MRGDSEPNGILEHELHLAPQRTHRLAVGAWKCRGRRSGSRPRSAGAAAARGRASICPNPNSPTMPIVWPSLQRQRDRGRRRCRHHRRALQEAAADPERHLDVAALEQDRRGWRPAAPCGRSARRRAASSCSRAAAERRSPRSRPASTTSPRAHHVDPVGEAADDAEIVGDEDDRHAEPALQVGEQRQDLRLDGDVERGRRLVGDQDVRIVGERHGDHHALALAARQFVRIGYRCAAPDRECRPASAVRARAARASPCE